MTGRQPKYLDIKDDLAGRIRRKEFAPGQPLPSQATLSRDYGVTLMTLRQALRCLQDEDVIVQKPGRGTFVLLSPTPPPTLDLRYLSSLITELETQGITLHTRLLDTCLGEIPAAVATALGYPRGTRGLRLERLRTIDDVPTVHQVSWVPDPWAEQLVDVDFQDMSLYSALQNKCGLTMASANETLRARALPRATARASGVKTGRASLIAERVTYDDRLRAVVHDQATILEDTVRVMVQRAPRRAQISWVADSHGPPPDAP